MTTSCATNLYTIVSTDPTYLYEINKFINKKEESMVSVNETRLPIYEYVMVVEIDKKLLSKVKSKIKRDKKESKVRIESNDDIRKYEVCEKRECDRDISYLLNGVNYIVFEICDSKKEDLLECVNSILNDRYKFVKEFRNKKEEYMCWCPQDVYCAIARHMFAVSDNKIVASVEDKEFEEIIGLARTIASHLKDGLSIKLMEDIKEKYDIDLVRSDEEIIKRLEELKCGKIIFIE